MQVLEAHKTIGKIGEWMSGKLSAVGKTSKGAISQAHYAMVLSVYSHKV